MIGMLTNGKIDWLKSGRVSIILGSAFGLLGAIRMFVAMSDEYLEGLGIGAGLLGLSSVFLLGGIGCVLLGIAETLRDGSDQPKD
jgi:hypothetical protein